MTPLDLSGLSYERFLSCVHCGLCTSACPTYLETGNENDSPRGRIHLMRAVADGRLEPGPQVQRHLDLCLDCRSCETACPSGVRYGSLIEGFRIAQEQTRRRPLLEGLIREIAIFGVFPYRRRAGPAMLGARLFQRLGLDGLLRAVGLFARLPEPLQKMLDMLPRPGQWQSAPAIPEFTPAVGPRRARVAFFAGCALSVMFPRTNYNTVRVLARNGCDVVTPAGQVCCGAIHYHAGRPAPALTFARANIALFNRLGVDAVVNNCAGCGHMLRHYSELFADPPAGAGAAARPPSARQKAAAEFQGKVRDVSEFLAQLGPLRPDKPVELTVTYHDACHLVHGQKVRSEPRALLAAVPGLKLVDLRESDICCGAAGTYNLTEPQMSRQLAARKAGNIAAGGAQAVVVGNMSCAMQIRSALRAAGLATDVIHPMDLLAKAYGMESNPPAGRRG